MPTDKAYYSNLPVRVIGRCAKSKAKPETARDRCKAKRRFILITGNRYLSVNDSSRVQRPCSAISPL